MKPLVIGSSNPLPKLLGIYKHFTGLCSFLKHDSERTTCVPSDSWRIIAQQLNSAITAENHCVILWYVKTEHVLSFSESHGALRG